MTLQQKIVEHLLGRKYWANIVRRDGTAINELCCYIFTNEAQARTHRDNLKYNATFDYVETITFRSRNIYRKHPQCLT